MHCAAASWCLRPRGGEVKSNPNDASVPRRSSPQTACLDFVVPSPAGTTWGLGGTCVNVGCIPKKLMHQAGLLGEGLSDAKSFGWKLSSDGHDWEKMVTGIQEYIGSLNWGYRVALRDSNVTYLNAKGVFVDAHTLQCTKKNGKVDRPLHGSPGPTAKRTHTHTHTHTLTVRGTRTPCDVPGVLAIGCMPSAEVAPE